MGPVNSPCNRSHTDHPIVIAWLSLTLIERGTLTVRGIGRGCVFIHPSQPNGCAFFEMGFTVRWKRFKDEYISISQSSMRIGSLRIHDKLHKRNWVEWRNYIVFCKQFSCDMSRLLLYRATCSLVSWIISVQLPSEQWLLAVYVQGYLIRVITIVFTMII